MAWRPAKSLETLLAQVNDAYPKRSKASDGILGDTAHSKVKSEHNPNSKGVVTAMDITHDPKHGADMNELAKVLIKDPRTWYVIFNKRIWEAGKWTPYYGSNDHSKHLHISTKQDARNYDNNNAWGIKEDETINRGRAIRLLRLTRRGTSEKQIQALIGRNEDEWLDEVYKASWFKEQTAKLASSVANNTQALKDKIINLIKGA